MEMHLFAGVAVSDFDRAVVWYQRLFGKPPAFEAHATEWVWTLAEHRSIYVVLRPERAGFGMVTVFVDDLDGFVESAAPVVFIRRRGRPMGTVSVKRPTGIRTATRSASAGLRWRPAGRVCSCCWIGAALPVGCVAVELALAPDRDRAVAWGGKLRVGVGAMLGG